ncbi:MAG: Flp pilus assembly complex ATPase component TadA [Planctomycetes bacterium]|nr:Flp pilus assembly complex ATPase component TadA [Planctomycetota bacterium]
MEHQDPVISVLLEEEILDDQGVRELVSEQDKSGKSLISLLRTRELVDHDQLTKLTAVSNGIEYVNLVSDMIDPVAVRLVSYDFAHQHNLIPVRIEQGMLYVAMSSPLNLAARDAITTKTGYKVVPLATTREAVNLAIETNFDVKSVTQQDIVTMRLRDSGEADSKVRKQRGKSANVADAPVVRLVDSIITGGIDSRSSDIHLEPHEPDMRVRYRIDGIMINALEVPVSAQREVISHIKILADMDISERRIPQDGHMGIHHNGRNYDLRVSSLPSTGGEKIVLRILDSSKSLQAIDQVITSQADCAKVQSLITKPYGMILLTGPTGSGKTTTLYSMIQALNTPEKNIVTVEDPVEYRLNGITQIQVKPEINMTFASSLRSILRQDPDIVLIGEIRDLETAEIAVSAALTGHLVLSTLHTNDAVGAVSRLVNLGIAPFQVSSALLGVMAQRLARTICLKCKEPYKPTPQDLAMLFEDGAGKHRNAQFYKGKGCESCRGTGYRGREGLFEIFEMDSTLRNMIVEGVSNDQLKACAMAQGMKTLRMKGIERILEGSTTLEEIARVVNMKED